MASPVSHRRLRAAYSLAELAELANISVDDLLEKFIQKGALDLYVRVPHKYTVYSLVKNYLDLESSGVANVIGKIRIQPRAHKEIEALRLSRRDCQALVAYGRVEQKLFGAGLAKSENMDFDSGGHALEPVLLRDWHFIPGQLERFEREFGYGDELSEASRDALEKGVTFRSYSGHGGGASDFSFLGRGGQPLSQRYEYFFGLYLSSPRVDLHTGISTPEALDITEADVFVIRADAEEFLRVKGRLCDVQEGLAPGSNPMARPDYHVNLCPDASWSYWLKALFEISKEVWGGVDPLNRDTWPSKSEVVLKILAKNYGNEEISTQNAEQAATLITPLWARTNTAESRRQERGAAIYTPEFEKMVIVAKKVEESLIGGKGKPPIREILKAWLMDGEHCSLSGTGADTACWLIKLKRNRSGAPKKKKKSRKNLI